MRKIDLLLLCGLLLSGCSVTRSRGINAPVIFNGMEGENICETVQKQNITSNNFFIQKAEIELINEGRIQKFISNIKFEKPNKYLISLKSKTGIEGARIFISNDTVLINDRLNKRLYFGNSLSLVRKYGFSISCFPLIFGDLILENNFKQGINKCIEEKLNISSVVKGVPLRYEIDCKKKKVVYVNQEKLHVSEGFRINFKNFIEINGSMLPKIIEFTDNQYNTTIRIKVLKIETPWKGSIIFIPGKGYESIEIV